LKTTRYFEEQVLRKRPYLRREWCEQVLMNPLKREVQPDGRVRYWGIIEELGRRVLRVVTLEDGETVLRGPKKNASTTKTPRHKESFFGVFLVSSCLGGSLFYRPLMLSPIAASE
jgi:hypothetical protein